MARRSPALPVMTRVLPCCSMPPTSTSCWSAIRSVWSSRRTTRPFLIADLPFMSYPSRDLALQHSVRLMQEGGAQMVKLESGGKQTEIVEFLAGHDIAVCAHVGLKPQSVHKTGGFRVQGRERETAARLLDEARRLESAGADIVLLECIPAGLGKTITAELHV